MSAPYLRSAIYFGISPLLPTPPTPPTPTPLVRRKLVVQSRGGLRPDLFGHHHGASTLEF